jgi:hypothetical protein
MSEEKIVPEWIFQNKQSSEYVEKNVLSKNEIERVLSMSHEISDEKIVEEKEKIEKCASVKIPYYYNIQWPESVKSELKEYASVCKMDMGKFKGIDPSSLADKVVQEPIIIKTASTIVESSGLVIDAFNIDNKIVNSHEKIKWEPELQNAKKLAEKPSMSGIVPIRGGEDYFDNSESKVARGQNSISDPNAIGKLAESSVEDTGARLKREKKEKEEQKKTNHEQWQKEKIEAMNGKEILPNRHIFVTESLNAQPGIKGDVFDFDGIPDKTAGERLKQVNEERKEKIRGKEKGKYEFVLSSHPTRTISEDFGEELKKHLGQID